jgi:hypothetical protein
VHLPGEGAADVVYEGITPVNLIRRVLNASVGTDLPALPDESYLSSDSDGRHLLTDVTGRTDRSSGADIEPRDAG